MIPFYLFYSMFGFQRVGDLIWALADARGRGFLLGCTAGRTTLNGEGLQHQDGHSLLLASTVPSVAAYDPAFAYEVAAIVEDGIRRMTGPDAEDRYWYLTLYNENYPMPALPPTRSRPSGSVWGSSRACTASARAAGRAAGRRRGATGGHPAVLGIGLARDVEAQRLLAADWGVDAEVWSVTSYKRCGRTPSRWSGGTGCTPGSRHVGRSSPSRWTGPAAPSWR